MGALVVQDQTVSVLQDLLRKLTEPVVAEDGGLLQNATLEETMGIVAQADLLQVCVRRAHLGLEAQNRCAYIKLLAQRRAGQLLAQVERTPGSRGVKETSLQREARSAGLALATAHRWQVIARVPEAVVRRRWQEADARGTELTTTEVYKLGRQMVRGCGQADQTGRVRLSVEERYQRLLNRIAHFLPVVQAIALLPALDRGDLDELLTALQDLRSDVNDVIARVQRRIEAEIHDYQMSGEESSTGAGGDNGTEDEH